MCKWIVLTYNFYDTIALNHETSDLRCSIRKAEILVTVISKKHTRNSWWGQRQLTWCSCKNLKGKKKRQKTPLLKSCIIMWKLHAFVGQLRWMNCILRLAAAPNTVKLILFSVPQKKSYLQARVSVIKTWTAPWVASIDWCYSRETSIAINLLNIQVEIGCICPFA